MYQPNFTVKHKVIILAGKALKMSGKNQLVNMYTCAKNQLNGVKRSRDMGVKIFLHFNGGLVFKFKLRCFSNYKAIIFKAGTL